MLGHQDLRLDFRGFDERVLLLQPRRQLVIEWRRMAIASPLDLPHESVVPTGTRCRARLTTSADVVAAQTAACIAPSVTDRHVDVVMRTAE